jgi:HK97 gp10 family phage protein
MANMNLGRNKSQNGFNYSEFDDLIKQLENLGADMDAVTEAVLDAGNEPAKQAFIRCMPPDSTTKHGQPHARDNVVVSPTRKAKNGSKYRLVGTLDRRFVYLYYVEYGHSKAPPHPFIEKAYREARAAAREPMEQELIRQIEKHLR